MGLIQKAQHPATLQVNVEDFKSVADPEKKNELPFGVAAKAFPAASYLGKARAVKADGNCWWRSVAVHLGQDERMWQRIRKYIRGQAKKAPGEAAVSRSCLRKEIRTWGHRGKWADAKAVAATAAVLNKRLAIHMSDITWIFEPVRADDTWQIILDNGHFSPADAAEMVVNQVGGQRQAFPGHHAIWVAGGGAGQARGRSRSRSPEDEDLYIDGHEVETMATVIRQQYTWRQAFQRAPIGFRVHGRETMTCTDVTAVIARRLHLRRALVAFQDRHGRLVPPDAQVGEGVVWTMVSRTVAQAVNEPPAGPHLQDIAADLLQPEEQPAEEAPAANAPNQPEAAADQRADQAEGQRPPWHDGPRPQPNRPRPSRAPHLRRRNDPDEIPPGRPRSPSYGLGVNLLLRMPSVYEREVATRRRRFRLPVRGVQCVEVEVEEGVYGDDYAQTLPVIDPHDRQQEIITEELYPGDMVVWQGDVVLDIAGIRGGGRGAQSEGPIQESQLYYQALTRAAAMTEFSGQKQQLKAVLRAVPKLPRKVHRATTDADAAQAIHAAAQSIGLTWGGHTAQQAAKGKGTGSAQNRPKESQQPPTYAAAVRSRSAPKKMTYSYRLMEEDWPVPIRTSILPGCPGVLLARSPTEAASTCREYLAKIKGAIALVSRCAIDYVPKDKQHPITVRVQEYQNNEPTKSMLATAYIIQLGDDPVWPMAMKEQVVLNSVTDRTTVIAMEILKPMAGTRWELLQQVDVKRYKETFMAWLPTPAPHPATFDIFSIKLTGEKVDFLMRIPVKMLDATLARAGTEGIFPRPRGRDLPNYTVQWLAGPDAGYDQAKELAVQHRDHIIGVAHKDGQFGLRTAVARIDALRAAMGLVERPNFLIKGIPIDASHEFVEQFCQKIAWPARLTRDPKRIKKQMAEWAVKADKPPENELYHVATETHKLHVEIVPWQRRNRTMQTAGVKARPAPVSWGAAAKPGIYAAETSSDSEVEGDQKGWEESEYDHTEPEAAEPAEMDTSEDPFDEEHVPVSPPRSGQTPRQVRMGISPASSSRHRSVSAKRKMQDSPGREEDPETQRALHTMQAQVEGLQQHIQALMQQMDTMMKMVGPHIEVGQAPAV